MDHFSDEMPAGRLATDGYGWHDAESPGSCAYLTTPVLDILRSLAARRVVDIGCGNGALCAFLSEAGFEVVGLEADAAGVEVCRRTYPHLAFHRCSVESDPAGVLSEIGGQPFDAAVSTEVVEHLYAPHLLPRFARDLLCDKGHLVVSTPYHGYLKNLAICIAGRWDEHHTPLWYGGHIKFWSRRTLTELLAVEGFDVVGFRGVGRAPLLWKSMLLVARRLADGHSG